MAETIVSAPVEQDGWAILMADIERAIQRVARLSSPTIEDLRTIIKGDVLPMLHDAMKTMAALRDVVYPALDAHADHLDELEDRFVGLEGIASDTQLLPEDAELILNVAGGSKLLCIELLKTAVGEGRVKLEEMIAMCTQLEELAKNKVIGDDDEDEDEGEDDGDDEGAADEPQAGGPTQ